MYRLPHTSAHREVGINLNPQQWYSNKMLLLIDFYFYFLILIGTVHHTSSTPWVYNALEVHKLIIFYTLHDKLPFGCDIVVTLFIIL